MAAVVLLVALVALRIGIPFCRQHIEIKKRLAQAAARAIAEPWRETEKWRGTQLGPTVTTPETVLKAFADDPPAPEERKAMFAAFLHRSARYKCYGWYGTIDAVEPNADGWQVVVKISPHLGVANLPVDNIETWQVSKEGLARCVTCAPGKYGPGPFGHPWMVD